MTGFKHYRHTFRIYLRMRYLTLGLLLLPCLCLAQAIDNTNAYRNMGERYLRLQYENDVFRKTDQYYTQGVYAEVLLPALRGNPVNYILVRPSGWRMQYGLAVELNAYTPTSIVADTILTGDHPYAGAMMLRSFSIATDTVRRQRISTTLTLGVIGPAAGGEAIQKGIHSATGDAQPRGWQYQVANDVIVNYRLQYEKNLLQVGGYLSLDGVATVDAGTLLTQGGVGLTLMAGYFSSAYSDASQDFQAYVYVHPQGRVVGYEATLQGGLFNSNSAYTIPAGDVERLVLQNRYGMVLRYRNVYLEGFVTNITRRFSTGAPHAWAGVQLGVGL